MPSIRGIDLSNGIKIDGVGIASVNLSAASFSTIGTIADREAQINRLVQSAYEYSELLSSITPDEGPRQKLPILNPRQRIEKIGNKDYLITKRMFVAIHLFSLTPLKYTICCSDGPIEGEWWL